MRKEKLLLCLSYFPKAKGYIIHSIYCYTRRKTGSHRQWRSTPAFTEKRLRSGGHRQQFGGRNFKQKSWYWTWWSNIDTPVDRQPILMLFNPSDDILAKSALKSLKLRTARACDEKKAQRVTAPPLLAAPSKNKKTLGCQERVAHVTTACRSRYCSVRGDRAAGASSTAAKNCRPPPR